MDAPVDEKSNKPKSELKSRTVFGIRPFYIYSDIVGNIPYDSKEDELTDAFQLVGPIKQFRLDHEKESGKPKGYGFCEYLDPEYAASALRNLNKMEFRGRRLRVCHASNDKTTLKKTEAETAEYQKVLTLDESTMKLSEIAGLFTAKQKLSLLNQLMVSLLISEFNRA